MIKTRKRLSSFQIILIGFALVILVGAILLSLPFSSAKGEYTPFVDSLFTSTSAVCVTGLIVFDTATHWSVFGQVVILLLIQIGGMGVVTVAMSFAMLAGKKVGLTSRGLMQEAISAPNVGGILKLTGFIIKGVFLIELLGALIMMPSFISDFGAEGIWMAIFHSISAFCNAGFDIMGKTGEFSSLTAYSAHPVINITIMLLIIIGGIGFLTWDDVRRNKFRFRKYRLQSKIIFIVTGLLILLPAIYMFFFEFQSLPLGERILVSLFQAVTPRTAGFNTIDYTTVSQVGLLLTIVLMLIGGSPGSTAGGMKTTTFAVIFSTMFSVFRRRNNTKLLNRRVEDGIVKNAFSIFMLYITLFVLSASIISVVEELPLLDCMFETASAVGTVGLSLGLTPTLGILSKIILMFLMFFGRVGGLTLIYAAFSRKNTNISKLPMENVTVG